MRLLVTSVVRGACADEPSGFVHEVDFTYRRQVAACPIPEPPLRALEPNPRGGMRGGKGIAVTEGSILIANSSAIHVYDQAWKPVRLISHPSCAGIHDIGVRGGELWVTSARNDLLFRFTLRGVLTELFDFRTDGALLAALDLDLPNVHQRAGLLAGTLDFRDPRTHRSEDHDGGHVNSVCFLPGGAVLMSLGQFLPRSAARHRRAASAPGREAALSQIATASGRSAIVRIAPDGSMSPSLRLAGASLPNHSLVARPDGSVLYAETHRGDVLRFDPLSGLVTGRVHVADEFLRGLALVAGPTIVAGGGQTLYEVNLATGSVSRVARLSDDPRLSIYAVHALPRDVAALPERLPDRDGAGGVRT